MILYKRLEQSWLWAWEGVLEPIPLEYLEMTVFGQTDE